MCWFHCSSMIRLAIYYGAHPYPQLFLLASVDSFSQRVVTTLVNT